MNKSKGAAAKVREQVKREERARRLCQGERGEVTLKIFLDEDQLVAMAEAANADTTEELKVLLELAFQKRAREQGQVVKTEVKILRNKQR